MNARRISRGFSIIELLIAVIIITVLTLVMVPTLLNRAEKAKITACQQELEHLMEAQRRAALDLGYFFRFYALDDVKGEDNLPNSDTDNRIDGIGDEELNITHFVNPEQMVINITTQNFIVPLTSIEFYNQLKNQNDFWTGPYYTIRRDEPIESHGFDLTNTPPLDARTLSDPLRGSLHLHGIPNDPWGNDYLFFTRTGVLIEPTGIFHETFYMPGSAVNVYDANIFDRPTILSLGPNGVPGNPDPIEDRRFGRGDDLYMPFGF